MKRTVIFLSILLAATFASAQQMPYQSVVSAIEAGSPIFAALKSQQQAQQLGAYAGALFDDPEVEFGYYWGSPTEVGHRWDLSIMQSFDMPSVIKHRNRIRQLLSQEAEIDYRLRRAELLKEVLATCNDIVYYRQCVEFYSRCVSRSEQLADLYSKREKEGDCSILEYNRVKMDLHDLQNKLAMAQVDVDMSLANLKVLNGGKDVAFAQATFDSVVLPSDIDAYIRSCQDNGSTFAIYSLKNEQSAEELGLARAEYLPKIQAGYKSENVVGETFRGVAVGLSLPLWNKHNTVKHAQFENLAIQEEGQARIQEQQIRIQGLYRKALSLQSTLASLRETYYSYDSEELLLKAFNAGELSLETYLQQVEFYHDFRMTIIETERELNAIWVELLSYNL